MARAMASASICVFLVTTACLIQMVSLARKKVYYADLEHVNITHRNPKYMKNVNATCSRYGRKDPVHYCHFQGETLAPAGNNVLLDYYVYEFLSNEYRRSFVEAHFRLCDLLFNHPFFSPFISMFMEGLPKTCPMPPMFYNVHNISVIDLPFLRTLPFQKGRLFLNVTGRMTPDSPLEIIVNGYLDGAIKQMWINY